jgi:hypothetical protein
LGQIHNTDHHHNRTTETGQQTEWSDTNIINNIMNSSALNINSGDLELLLSGLEAYLRWTEAPERTNVK